jgi:hypothetical protein
MVGFRFMTTGLLLSQSFGTVEEPGAPGKAQRFGVASEQANAEPAAG